MGDGDRDILKAIGLLAVLEPVPGLIADVDTLAWSLGRPEASVAASLDALIRRNLVYRRPHRADHSLWSRSSVDLGDWLAQDPRSVPAPNRLHNVAHPLPDTPPLVAHRPYHQPRTTRPITATLFNTHH